MVNYIEAASAPMKNTGAIKLYGADAFEGMRRACQLTANCLDELVDRVKPGVTVAAVAGSMREVLVSQPFKNTTVFFKKNLWF